MSTPSNVLQGPLSACSLSARRSGMTCCIRPHREATPALPQICLQMASALLLEMLPLLHLP